METIFARCGRLGVVLLNRPQVLNALGPGQFSEIHRQLEAWAEDRAITAVLLEGAGERAFCAGGDIRAAWDAKQRADLDFNRRLFRDEYRLDRLVHHYPKPVISFLDGIVMGGGAGISINGRYRIATERSLFAMPEAAIGFFPDVGATHFLSRCPGRIGLYLGLTGARLGAADMIWAGLATHFVPFDQLPALKARLAQADDMAAVLDAAHRDAGSAPLAMQAESIERCFHDDSVADILARLAAQEGQWAEVTRAAMSTASPTSLAVIHRQLTKGKVLDFDTAIAREYRMACHLVEGEEFYEGIRAMVVDKDKRPRWQPAALEGVTPKMVDDIFAPVGAELSFEPLGAKDAD